MNVLLVRRPRWGSRERHSFWKGILYISPWLIGFIAFTAYPIMSSLYYSFTDYDIISASAKWVGLANFQKLLFRDDVIGIVLYNTFYYVLIGVPAVLVTSFFFAFLLSQEIFMRSLFRTIFYIPSIVPTVASAMIWLWLFNMQYGLINSFIALLGGMAVPFLASPDIVKLSLILISCWGAGGTMVIFLAALKDVPRSLYDAAIVDGANGWRRFWNITVPMCTPAILFNLITGMIGAFQYFAFAWILTQGGPNRASLFYAMYLYQQGFVYLNMGYASAMAWGLFLIVVVVTVIIYRDSSRWVFYGGAQ